ncbi:MULTISPECIES: HAD family hydrolase [unclassified Wenzhouxiangella]|uniref:KdsC family phosphatase n=1 Tax=unclassified Wenzhouxiangella TaxID=2613841 RepID=UPI000E327B68|nr:MULTISPECIES: HAD family hydrolase [unclassified Wenzhouxiangella]RFF28149.1 HAD family hydrolase [Wenzhouxiangella sp. 15181]RFP67984.1 HAD family hydrolase [Wenzhouxiangella sp. 15190]
MNSDIRLAVFDVDGVMTDGRIAYTDDGHEIKTFHTRDGLGLKGLQHNGIAVAIITARNSPIVARRAAELGIEHLVQGREDKAAALDELMARLSLTGEKCAYTGDDLVDWPAMRRCGFKCAPADASAWIRERADFVTQNPGGHGAAREVCERILAERGLLEAWQGRFE